MEWWGPILYEYYGGSESVGQTAIGPEEWLQPYTDKTVEKLAREGVKSIAVFNPGFVSDCLETLEEIQEECREAFLHAGGDTFRYIPCLNDDEKWVQALTNIVKRHLQGWSQAA